MYHVSLCNISFSPEQEQDIVRRFLQVAREQMGTGDKEERQVFDKMCSFSEFGSDWELACQLASQLGQSQEWTSDLVHWMAEKMVHCDGLAPHIKQIAEANWSNHPSPGRTPEQVDSITVDGELQT
ncbi:MAG: hypothetical protein HY974_02780 [Candidatus Kerfeldbacteria bacterium]|nr:hypothetical protein [Candidatus Kerfeldbacteria bacterium]